jgi:hypothetical protein
MHWLQSNAMGRLLSLMHCHVKPIDMMPITAYGDKGSIEDCNGN